MSENTQTELEQLKADNAKLATDLSDAQALITALTTERDALKSEKKTLDEAVAAKFAELRAENVTLKAAMEDFDYQVAAKVAEFGIRCEDSSPRTATERCLAAKAKHQTATDRCLAAKAAQAVNP